MRKPTFRRRFGIDAFDLTRMIVVFGIGVFVLVAGVVLLEIGGIVLGLVLTAGPVLVLLLSRWSQGVGR